MSVKGFLDKYFKPEPIQSAKVVPEAVLEPMVGTVPRIQMVEPKPAVFHIFADGACSDNGKRNAKAGYGVHVYTDSSLDISRRLLPTEQQTNNRAELRAIQAALDLIDRYDNEWKKLYSDYYIWTDSEYSINCLTKWAKGWKLHRWRKSDGKDILNLDLIQPLYDRLCLMPRVTFKHVRSHQASTQFPYDGNHRADLLATQSLH
jgi:ribonuclease HI